MEDERPPSQMVLQPASSGPLFAFQQEECCADGYFARVQALCVEFLVQAAVVA